MLQKEINERFDLSDYYSESELNKIGFKKIGINCLISKQIKINDASRVSIGNNVRIDPFCIITLGQHGFVKIGNNIHIADKVRIVGGGGLVMEDETNIGIGSTILSQSDDYSGDYFLGPMSSNALTNLKNATIYMKKFSVVATHSVVMPGVTLDEGSVLGAMSLAHRNLRSWTMYFGVPAVPIKPRSNKIKNIMGEL